MTGILLIQLGTPDAPTPAALKPYLRQFLSDPRVVETKPDTARYVMTGPARPPRPSVSAWFWKLLLNCVIVPFRSRASAEKYARIWDPVKGSPLMYWTKRQVELLQMKFPNNPVRFGMMIGNPPVNETVKELLGLGCDRIIALPMFPQYSSTTSASASDVLAKTLLDLRVVPAIRTVPPYYKHPSYIKAMAAVVRDDLAKLGWQPEHVVISFHGIPQKYAQRGDPYASHVVDTTQKLVAELGWPRSFWTQTYQSRFGKEPWLKPYTDDVLEDLAKNNKKNVMVVLPGFTSDCLETVDEIGRESAEVFHKAGGNQLRSCPCLNDHPAWIDAMEAILREEGQGWI